jgi:hypothetical protein
MKKEQKIYMIRWSEYPPGNHPFPRRYYLVADDIKVVNNGAVFYSNNEITYIQTGQLNITPLTKEDIKTKMVAFYLSMQCFDTADIEEIVINLNKLYF